MLSLSRLCKLRPQTSFREILLVLYFILRKDMGYHCNVKQKKKNQKPTHEAGNADWYWKLYLWKAFVPQKRLCQQVKEETAVNTDPKTSPKIQ